MSEDYQTLSNSTLDLTLDHQRGMGFNFLRQKMYINSMHYVQMHKFYGSYSYANFAIFKDDVTSSFLSPYDGTHGRTRPQKTTG